MAISSPLTIILPDVASFPNLGMGENGRKMLDPRSRISDNMLVNHCLSFGEQKIQMRDIGYWAWKLS
jgi:hypothetical protein